MENTVTEDPVLMEDKFPKAAYFILGNEFCERFSFYGMRGAFLFVLFIFLNALVLAVLTSYLRNYLCFEEVNAKVVYLLMLLLIYFFPIFGAITADSLLGKFRTILYVSIIYICGNIILALTSVADLGIPETEASLVGLILIAVTSGCIKPCVAAFSGDQFKLPKQERKLSAFFSMFYFTVNASALLSTIFMPILSRLECFSEDTCFPLSYTIAGIFMITGLFLFALGKPFYTMKEPNRNVIVETVSCIKYGISERRRRSSNDIRNHWLDYANKQFEKRIIDDTKLVVNVFLLYIHLPIFWALFDQQGSLWILQASRMNGKIGFYTVLPEQMQLFNPFFILIFIPIFEVVVYPFFAKLNIFRSLLQRFVTGGIIVAIAFGMSGVIALRLEEMDPVLPGSGEIHLRVYNAITCPISINNLDIPEKIIPPGGFTAHFYSLDEDTKNVTYKIYPKGCDNISGLKLFDAKLNEKDMVGLVIQVNHEDKSKFEVRMFEDDIKKSVIGYGVVRTAIYGPKNPENYEILYKLTDDDNEILDAVHINKRIDLYPGKWTVIVDEIEIGEVDVKMGGVYFVFIDMDSSTVTSKIVTHPNSMHIFWQIPQLIVVAIGEIMFVITGLTFTYNQAPASLKSIMQAVWLLTVAFGNVLVIAIDEISEFKKQSTQLFTYSAVMFLDMVVFIKLAMRYKYVEVQY